MSVQDTINENRNKLSISLNKIQEKIAKETEGAIMVTAGAGSGKTRLLTYRIFYLIGVCNVSPSNILAVTFTNKAAKEMRERVENVPCNIDGITVKTFHALCVMILRENIHHIEGFTKFFSIYDDSDQDKVLKKVMTDLKIEDDSIKSEIAYHISHAKNLFQSPQEYYINNQTVLHIDEICNIYAAYQEELKSNNALDFDDLLVKTMELLLNNEEVCAYYQNKFKYILVDEFQDTNIVQYNLIRALSAKWGNLFVIGDEDQCIYSWRGANITNIQNFLKDYDATLYKLEQNYRSTKNILNVANRLIKFNVERIEKTLFTENEEGSNINYFEAESESEEAEYVAKCIAKLYSLGVPYKDIGVLMRISALSRHFEEKLLNYNIPYVTSGIFKFFDRLEIKNILSYLKLLINPKDNVSLTRIINFPKRGIGDATVDKIQELAVSHNTHMLDIIENFRTIDDMPANIKSKIMEFSDLMVDLKANYENMGLTEIVKYVIEKIEIKGLYNTKSEEDIDRTMNIDQLIQSVMTYENNNDNVSLSDYIEGVSLASSIDNDNIEDEAVNLFTVHASKGLEFDYVFIVGAEEGCFPLSRAMDTPSEMEEERRLMYVAVTRAKKKLTITRAKSRFLYGSRNQTKESRFMKEAGLSRELYRKQMEEKEKESRPVVNTLNIMQSIRSSLNPSISTDNKVNNESEFQVGARVIHTKLGIGTITSTEMVGTSSYVTVDFGKPTGIKKLATKFAPIKIYKGN